ncbi:Tn7-like element transposition protein TnsE [Sulfuricurvum sp.]|uniref:Tn7-like element transposition protein TnsE n=1 Tax=Sulfuricurvum sp. TaxID=2025608 RepID=UPI002E2F99FC|nr:Tn7-like element transposition protein TnsE [Sulfuricurvum sp.]HEX5330625.1 Tn7-like element transposition protein TnsE [Sulfuricurvum sp.]
MDEFNYNDLTIENIPTGEYLLVWPNNINKYPTNTRDYFATLALKNLLTGELQTIKRNIKEIPALPLGTIIRDRKVTTEKVGELYNFNMAVMDTQTSINLSPDFFTKTNSYFSGLNTKIPTANGHLYNLEHHSKSQYGIELTKEENTVFFPAYVIAQYFYFRSASLIKQLMSATHVHGDAIRSLYKKIVVDATGNMSVLLSPGASPEDAPEIVRFATEPYANEMFHRIYTDLADSNMKNKAFHEKRNWSYPYNTASLQCYFPFAADVDITFRGVKLKENYYLALEIIQENSVYPFEKLTIYTEHAKRKNCVVPVGRINKKFRTQNITKNVTNLTPNSKFENIKVANGTEEDGRTDLIDKIIRHETIIVESDKDPRTIFENSEEGANLNSNHEEASGDENTVQMNPAFTDLEIKRETPGLDDFRSMLFQASEDFEEFSYLLPKVLPLPQKPEEDTSRKKWLRALLVDNETPRAYIVAVIHYNDCTYTVIDIEKDDRIPRASTLILRMDDYTKIPDNIVLSILTNYVREGRSWLHDMTPDNYTSTTLTHPQDSSKEAIKRWAKRLVDTLKDFDNM